MSHVIELQIVSNHGENSDPEDESFIETGKTENPISNGNENGRCSCLMDTCLVRCLIHQRTKLTCKILLDLTTNLVLPAIDEITDFMSGLRFLR